MDYTFDAAGIAAQRAVCDAATPGPWIESGCIKGMVVGDHGCAVCKECQPDEARFIAASREAWPAALTEIERLASQNKPLQEAYQRAQKRITAMIYDMALLAAGNDCPCNECGHNSKSGCLIGGCCGDKFEWRGPCADNAPEGSDGNG